MFGLGVPELMVILVIALVIFGPSKLPQIGSGLGKAIRDFKKGVTGGEDEETCKDAKKEDAKTCLIHKFSPISLLSIIRLIASDGTVIPGKRRWACCCSPRVDISSKRIKT